VLQHTPTPTGTFVFYEKLNQKETLTFKKQKSLSQPHTETKKMKTKRKITRKRINRKVFLLLLAFGLILNEINGQTIDSIDPTPKTPEVSTFKQPKIVNNQPNNPTPKIPQIYNPNLSTQERNQLLIQQADRQIEQRQQQRDQLIKEAVAEFDKPNRSINYNLPSFSDQPETEFYHKAFKQLSAMDRNNYSVKDATFIIENAYYEQKESKERFNQIIKETGEFLLQKMNDFGYDMNNNLAKNFILFRFFSDTLQVKGKDLKHFPINYDFDDYMGKNEWSKMFVNKLLYANTGQCNSMPRLYIILADEIGAEAYLNLAPNHTYIKFKDETNYWYNVELTNHMFTTNTMVLNSGYIKSEALNNGVYMKNLSKKELFSQMLTDFALGYTHKFGYDEFVKTIIDEALELYPNSINANMMLANYQTQKFEYVMQQHQINPRNKQELQNIRYFPKAIELLNKVNNQYDKIDNLGYELMSAQAYEKWLASLKNSKEKQISNEIQKDFENKLNLNKKLKD